MIINIQKNKPKEGLQRLVPLLGVLSILCFIPLSNSAQIEPGGFEFDGESRSYMVYLPENYNGGENFPLVFFLHPYGQTAQWGMDYIKLNEVADTSDFLVVYPSAIPNWNSGIGDNPAWPAPDVDDVGFINALIDTLINQYSIDIERIYTCGFSNGGFMSYKLACELSHRFAAMASVCGIASNTTASNCDPSNTMPVLQIHGTADAVVLIDGTTGWHSVDQTLSFWIDINACSQVDTISLPDLDSLDNCTVEKISYTNCTDDNHVVYFKVNNGGHSWPGAGPSGLPLGNTNQDIHASKEIWNFFKGYSLITSIEKGTIDYEPFTIYPNPCSGVAQIRITNNKPAYQSGRQQITKLEVFTISGRKIMELLNEEMLPGTYEVEVDLRELPAGVYYCVMRTMNGPYTAKLIKL